MSGVAGGAPNVEMTNIGGERFPVDAAKLLLNEGFVQTPRAYYWLKPVGNSSYNECYITFVWNKAYNAYVIKAEPVE
jgi:hypothetical protein